MSNLSPELISLLQQRRHTLRLKTDFAYFAKDYLSKRNDYQGFSKMHAYLCAELQKVADFETQNLMVQMPSGSGKTTILSRLFPAWLMQYQKGISIIGASHNGDFAESKVSQVIQDILMEYQEEFEVKLLNDSKRDWRTNNGCTYRAAGVQQGILGERADVGILDDPFGNAADAKSITNRNKVYDWWKGDFISRLKMGVGRKVLMHQRVHMDDLAGRILIEEPDNWKIVFVPAIWEGVDILGRPAEDVLGREIGQSCWPEYWTEPLLAQREMDMGAYAWASMMQQRPTPLSGTMVKIAQVHMIEDEVDLPECERYVRAWDYSASSGPKSYKSDWTVGALLGRTKSGSFVIRDIKREKCSAEQLEHMVQKTAEEDTQIYGSKVHIFLAQDPGSAGAYLSASLGRLLMGHNFEILRETGSKEARFQPFAAQINAGLVFCHNTRWTRELIEEMAAFPDSKHDDQCDALASAFNCLVRNYKEVVPPSWGFTDAFVR